MIGSEPDVSIIGRLLFVIPADRVAAAFRGFLVEEDPREVTPSSFNESRGCARDLVWYTQDVKLRSQIAILKDVANTLSPAAPSCGRITQALPHPRSRGWRFGQDRIPGHDE